MGIKSVLAQPFARVIHRQTARWGAEAVQCQEILFKKLLAGAAETAFGREHGFHRIRSHADFVKAVPLREYEAFEPYLDRIKSGESDVLWKGRPIYLAKSSGTTSGVKYIPITGASIPNHINSARNALLLYIHQTGQRAFTEGKMIFLSGSPELERVGGILTGRLSGIVNHHVPRYLRGNQLPSYRTNCIEDWETKLDQVVEETLHQRMTLISGIPPWVQMYFDRLLARSGKQKLLELFPQLQLMVYGGVNFEPYRARLLHTVGGALDTLETYPASEGFLAFQDLPAAKQTTVGNGLWLNINSGIFFEFVPAREIHSANPSRLLLPEVETGENYALVLSSNAGLWSYVIGDTVRFVSKNPYRIVVSGRIKHFISAFGEHVIAEEVETALQQATAGTPIEVVEFTVAPQVNPPEGGLPYHEWLMEFTRPPADLADFAAKLDRLMCQKNIYYNDLITGNIIQPLKVTPLPPGAFRDYMKSKGKLGGQNKVPRLSNQRDLAEELKRSLAE